jgi:glycosyltransferase involved in cell wall biosynthesis
MLRLLHLTNWYPEPAAPERTPFIVEHWLALAPFVQQQLWHVEVQPSPRWRLRWARRAAAERALLLQCPLASGQLQELLTLLLLLLLRLRLIGGRWDLVVVHIAWPLLRFPRLVRQLFGSRLLLIEHWSAYHNRFQLPAGSPALRRLQGMFAAGIPVVAVSQALAGDLRAFSGRPDLPVMVVPNVVDTALFHPAGGAEFGVAGAESQRLPRHRWLMVASWAPIKRPLLVLQAIAALVADNPSLASQLRLKIVGGGEQVEAMAAFITAQQLQALVQLLGPQPKPVIAAELRQATALLHPSAYETFSVVCAEALCSGVPVLASDVGALPELITAANGLLVTNTPEAWTAALRQLLSDPPVWDHQEIAQEAAARFSRPVVGQQLLAVAQRVAAGPR